MSNLADEICGNCGKTKGEDVDSKRCVGFKSTGRFRDMGRSKDMPNVLCKNCGKSYDVHILERFSLAGLGACNKFVVPNTEYVIKDSGQREVAEGGMVRDTTEGKTDYMLAFDGPMFKRWAEHLTKGAKKYAKRNWMKAQGQEELDHALESLGHHFVQYLDGEQDEDHAAAIFFNINLIEYIKEKMRQEIDQEVDLRYVFSDNTLVIGEKPKKVSP